MDLSNRVIIITGSTGGIGHAIASSLSNHGATVVVTSRNIETAQETAEKIKEGGGHALPLAFSLAEPSTGQELISQTLSTFGRLDALVNNAIDSSTMQPLPIQQLSYEQIKQGLTVNLVNTIALTSLAYPELKKTKGNVLNIGSVVTNRYMRSIPLYAVQKGGLSQLTKALAAEWAEDGIRVNQINPALVKSDAFKGKGIPQEFQDAFYEFNRQFHPIGRIGTPEDIGPLAAFMLSEQASWMTGSIIDIDGGYSSQGVPTPEQTMREE